MEARRGCPEWIGMILQRSPLRVRSFAFALAVVGLVVAAFAAPSSALAASGCDRVASPSGSDSSPGAESSPYRSAQKLVQSLSAGQTGCLRQGTYTGSDLFLDAPGATLRSYPGERATIAAFLEVRPDAARAKVTQLRFDGTNVSNSTAVKLQANNTVFSDNEVTKGGKGICVQAGSYYPGRDIIIERNRIHNCGPADSKFDHQLYLGQTRNAIVRWNILTNNPGGWGVHLYTDADNTLIEHNIIDGNRGGVIFAGEGGKHSDNNTVRNNAITNNGPRWNIEGSWSGGPQGTGNTATNNCVYTTGPDAPAGIANNNGFTTTNNTVLNTTPYINRTTGDYRFKPGHPCTTLVGDVMGAITAGLTPTPTPAPLPIPTPVPIPAPAPAPDPSRPLHRPRAPRPSPPPRRRRSRPRARPQAEPAAGLHRDPEAAQAAAPRRLGGHGRLRAAHGRDPGPRPPRLADREAGHDR